MNLTSWERHKLKKSLKSAASLIRAIKGFAKGFQGIEPFGGRGIVPIGPGLLFRLFEAVRDFQLPMIAPLKRSPGCRG
jgi:hypothetical protein